MRISPLLLLISFTIFSCTERNAKPQQELGSKVVEIERPQYHFTPSEGWMNDPNGLVYHKGVYHLFYQYYPHATVWGPMHWGHATSRDMVHWQHKPIALFPDEHGLIFSGSAVVDRTNSSGFGIDGKIPLVAIFTYHDMQGEKAGKNSFQTQGIAYSLDNGATWTKYEENPVIENKGIRDLRDPKVFWHEDTNSWIMVLVAGDHAKFYRSKNLKQWQPLSDFGRNQGAHGGVWECPDLFKLKVEGSSEEKWVLLVSIGNGGPNGGSATQYFVGDFDGTTFTSDQKEYKWLDWGTDNYAGVTYNNTPNGERIFIGWMSNWQYALKTPANSWRSAMTLPRKLSLHKVDGDYMLYNSPMESINSVINNTKEQEITIAINEEYSISNEDLGVSHISFELPNADVKVTFSNDLGEKTTLILDSKSALLLLDRTASGITDFNYEFGNKLHYATLKDGHESLQFSVFLDHTSIEVFVNGGQYVMTDQLFPTEPYSKLTIENPSPDQLQINNLSIGPIAMVRTLD